MRIATFNVESLDVPPKARVPLAARIAVLRPQLERLAADVLCLQEVNGQHVAGSPHRALVALDQLLAGTRYQAFHRAVTPGPGGFGVADVHNLVTLSRWPVTNVHALRNEFVPALTYPAVTAISADGAPLSLAFERPILVCDVLVPSGPPLTVFNLHLRAPLATSIPGQKTAPFVWKTTSAWAEGYALSAWKRAAQALEARLAIDRRFDAEAQSRIVVLGDFNAEDHETPVKILIGADEDTGNGRLTARALVVLDRGIDADRRFSTIHHGRAQMVDHILISRPLLGAVRGLEIHNETLGDEAIAIGHVSEQTGSYHAPVVAELDLPGF